MRGARSKLDVRELLPVLSSGLVDGVIVLPLVISFAILIFSGELSLFLKLSRTATTPSKPY
jgi:hypothetical protein